MSVDLEEIAENPTIEQQVKYPLYLTEDSDDEKSIENVVKENVSTADVIVIGDTDADGLGAAGLLKAKYNESNFLYIPAGHRGQALDPVQAFLYATDAKSNTPIYVVDISPDEDSEDSFVGTCCMLADEYPVYIRDHHDWGDEIIERLEKYTESVEVIDEKCTAEIVHEVDWPDAPQKYKDLAYVTGLHDLWKKEEWEGEPRREDLSNYAFWSDSHEEYINAVAEYGANIRDDDEIDSLLDENLDLKEKKIKHAFENADWRVIPTDSWGGQEFDIGLAYGNAYASGVADRLISAGADIAAVVKPLGKVSLRCPEETPFSTIIAQQLNGNGHPSGEAAGCNPELVVSKSDASNSPELISYSEHWEQEGRHVKIEILKKIKSVLDEKLTDEKPDSPIDGIKDDEDSD